MSACPNCGGIGKVPNWWTLGVFSKDCPECGGSGRIVEVKNPYYGLRPYKTWQPPTRHRIPTVNDAVDEEDDTNPLLTVAALMALNSDPVVGDMGSADVLDDREKSSEDSQQETEPEESKKEETPVEAEPQTFTPVEPDTTSQKDDSPVSEPSSYGSSSSDSSSSDSGSSDSGSSGGE